MFDLSSFIWVVGRRKRREHNTVGYDLNIRGSVWPAGCGNVSNIKDNFSSDSLIKDTDVRETGGSALCNMNDIPSFLFLIWVMKYQACPVSWHIKRNIIMFISFKFVKKYSKYTCFCWADNYSTLYQFYFIINDCSSQPLISQLYCSGIMLDQTEVCAHCSLLRLQGLRLLRAGFCH